MARKQKLRLATCQFPVSGDLARNARYARRLMRQAADQGAHLLHFSETALSGYPGTDFGSFDGFDWDALRRETTRLRQLAVDLHLWLALGSSHYVDAKVKPTNCIYLIGDQGQIVDRYDKCMCTTGDLRHYTPGDRLVVHKLRGVALGLLVCYDCCYPEMYAAYRQRGVTVMLHSFHNAAKDGWTVLDELTPAQAPTRAADNVMWVLANNSCQPYQSWPSFISRPDASVAARLKRNTTGMLLHDFPDDQIVGWLHNIKPMKLHPDQTYHSGTASDHPRVVDGTTEP